jgi:hypothetical protein
MRPVSSLLVVLLLTTPVRADPQTQQAAVEAYQSGKFDLAAALFEQVVLETPEARWLYALAQSLRKAGRCEEAVKTYDRYLTQEVPEQDRLAALDARKECLEILQQTEKRKAEVTPAIAPVASPRTIALTPGVETDTSAPVSWQRDLLGGLLCGVGTAAVLTGSGLYASAWKLASDAADRPTHDAYDRQLERAGRRRTIAAVSAGVGAALLAAGITRYIVVSKRRVTVTPSGGNSAKVGLSLHLEF